MGLLSYFKEKRQRKIRKEQQEKQKAIYQQKVKEAGDKNIPIDSISFMYCIDPSRKEDERSYSKGDLAFDYVIPIIRSGNRYFNIMTLEELFTAGDDTGYGKTPFIFFYGKKISNAPVPDLLKCVGIEDVEMVATPQLMSRDSYDVKFTSKNGLDLEVKAYNTNNYDGIVDFIQIHSLRGINSFLNKSLTNKFNEIRKRKEHKEKNDEARDFVDSLGR